jgi:hypothetical protein
LHIQVPTKWYNSIEPNLLNLGLHLPREVNIISEAKHVELETLNY